VTNVNFDALAKEDADHDGVPDIDDDEPNTPANVKVDANGKALDSDGDGIPDYLDKEPNSAKDALVNEEGVTITEQMIEEKLKRDSLQALPAIKEYLKTIDKLSGNTTETKPPADPKDLLSKATNIPKKYRKVDLDFNGIISPQEISEAIDEYLAGKSTYSTEEFYGLIDFFFKQH